MVSTPLPKNISQSLSNWGQGEQSFPMPLFDKGTHVRSYTTAAGSCLVPHSLPHTHHVFLVTVTMLAWGLFKALSECV